MRIGPRRLAAVAAIVIMVGAAGCGQPRSEPPRRRGATVASPVPANDTGPLGSSSGVPPDHAGPTTVVDGAPMGYRRDAAGAKAAALSFARLNQSLAQMDMPAAAAAWRAMAAESSADHLGAEVAARLARIRQRWPAGALSYRVAPLAVRVAEAGLGRVRVDVWYVAVVAARDLPTYEEWVTESYVLVWERGDWRVLAFSDAPGPRPEPGPQKPAPAAEIDARLTGFEAL